MKIIQNRAVAIIFTMIVVLVFGTLKSIQKPKELGEQFLFDTHEAVKRAYGDSYIPSVPIDEETLENVYGVPMRAVESYVAEGAMMSVHVDVFIGVKARQGFLDEVVEALEAYQEFLITNSFEYPLHQAKVEASKVYVVEDHVYFLILGETFATNGQVTNEQIAYAEEQLQIAIDAIEKLIN